jgi:hypothetical protein
VAAYITPKFSQKCYNNSKKKRRERGEGSEEEVVKVPSSTPDRMAHDPVCAYVYVSTLL